MPAPRLYIFITYRLGTDVGGTLYDHEGEPLWSHLSSSVEWLKVDLVGGFTSRREDLAKRYPDGYEVVLVNRDIDNPDATYYAELVALWDSLYPGWREEKP